MAEYRDPLGALLERIAHLEKQLGETRAAQPIIASVAETLRLEKELHELEAAWRERRERLRALADRRRGRVKLASTLLFFLMCAGSIAAMALGQVAFGLFFFLASVTGWALAGLQNGRQALLFEAYEHDRARVERALAEVRRALPRLRVEEVPLREEAPMDLDADLIEEIERIARR